MLALPEVPGVYCDAHLVDDSGLRFLSLWGRDTAIQAFLARLSLPEREGGLGRFSIGGPQDPEGRCHVPFVDPQRLCRTTARLAGSVFGELVQLWLYDRLAVEPDRASGRALLLHRSDEPWPEDALWMRIKHSLWLPVLDHWRDTLLARLREMDRVRPLTGYRVGAVLIDLSEPQRIEEEIAFLVRSGRLTLEADPGRTRQVA
ncbi:MAG TPA: hypothetical protein VK971_03665 [Thiohalobacter sp.]|nr:hypothetical protein [Thiohalobacter sp.]